MKRIDKKLIGKQYPYISFAVEKQRLRFFSMFVDMAQNRVMWSELEIDDDGFLFIEGRLSRFSKIAGEMVPHGTVEEALVKAYNLFDAELPILAVVGRPDESKGEALVILATMDLELDDVREKLSAAGLTNLWIPKEIKRVETIPTLATGKLDLRKIQVLASES